MPILGLVLGHRGRIAQLRQGLRLFARLEYRGSGDKFTSEADTKEPDRFIEKPGDNFSWEIADGAAESLKSRESASGA